MSDYGKNSPFIDVLNTQATATVIPENVANLINPQPQDVSTMSLQQGMPSTFEGSIGSIAGGSVVLLGSLAVGVYNYVQYIFYRKQLANAFSNNLQFSPSTEPEAYKREPLFKLLKKGTHNTRLLEDHVALGEFLSLLLSQDLNVIVEVIKTDLRLLQLLLNPENRIKASDDMSLPARIRKISSVKDKDYPALDALRCIGVSNPEIAEFLASPPLRYLGQVTPYRRSLTMPSGVGFPLVFSTRLFLGTAFGSVLGGLVGTLIAGPGIGTSIGVLVGIALSNSFNEVYVKLAPRIREYWLEKERKKLDATTPSGDSITTGNESAADQTDTLSATSLPRAWYREAHADVPLYARLSLGFLTGAMIGGAWGIVFPGLGNLLGGLIGGSLGAFASVISPYAFHFIRWLGRRSAVKSGVLAAQVSAQNNTTLSRHWYSESGFNVHWYIRTFIAALGGAPLGAAIGGFIATVLGGPLATMPGMALGAAIGVSVNAFLALITPAMMALGRNIRKLMFGRNQFERSFATAAPIVMKSEQKEKRLSAEPFNQPNTARVLIPYDSLSLDVPSYVRFTAGALSGMLLGSSIGSFFPGVGNLTGMLIGGFVGSVGLSLAAWSWPMFRVVWNRGKTRFNSWMAEYLKVENKGANLKLSPLTSLRVWLKQKVSQWTGITSDPQVRLGNSSRLTWYVRLLVGTLLGNSLGNAVGYIAAGAIAGSFLPGAGTGAGAALGGIVGVIACSVIAFVKDDAYHAPRIGQLGNMRLTSRVGGLSTPPGSLSDTPPNTPQRDSPTQILSYVGCRTPGSASKRAKAIQRSSGEFDGTRPSSEPSGVSSPYKPAAPRPQSDSPVFNDPYLPTSSQNLSKDPSSDGSVTPTSGTGSGSDTDQLAGPPATSPQ